MAGKSSRARSSQSESVLPLRITVQRPPPGVLFCVQGRPGEYLSQTRSKDADLVFDFDVRVVPGDQPRLLGAVVQGSPVQRFVYVCSGTYAGDKTTCWSRRAKVPLIGITSDMVAKRPPGKRLSAAILGTAADGGPACASVPLLGPGWRWQP